MRVFGRDLLQNRGVGADGQLLADQVGGFAHLRSRSRRRGGRRLGTILLRLICLGRRQSWSRPSHLPMGHIETKKENGDCQTRAKKKSAHGYLTSHISVDALEPAREPARFVPLGRRITNTVFQNVFGGLREALDGVTSAGFPGHSLEHL